MSKLKVGDKVKTEYGILEITQIMKNGYMLNHEIYRNSDNVDLYVVDNKAEKMFNELGWLE